MANSNMEGPGMSLFQGAPSIHINNSAQDRLEEQEELEDQKRRKEELEANLHKAFEEFSEDEASSDNSNGDMTMDPRRSNGTPLEVSNHQNNRKYRTNHSKSPHCASPIYETHKNPIYNHMMPPETPNEYYPRGAGDGQNPCYQETRGHMNGMNHLENHESYEKLKVLYEMRVKECQDLVSQLEEVKLVANKEIDSLRVRLSATISDKDKAEMSLQQTLHLLATSKHKSLERDTEIQRLNEKLSQLGMENDQLKIDLRSTNIALQTQEQRMNIIQNAQTHDTDALFREQQDRHREEVDRLHNDLQKARNRLEEKENEIKRLERRCKEKEKEKEEILIEKSSTVNRLVGELDAAQSRLLSGETNELKEKVAQLNAERKITKDQVKEFGAKLEVTAHELMLQRKKTAACEQELNNYRTEVNQLLRDMMPDSHFIGEPSSPGKLFSSLKDLVSRYKLQLQKVPNLQDEISKRDKKLEQYRKQESELRSELEQQKGMEMQLTSKIAVLKNKLELLDTNSDGDLLETYKQQNESLQQQMEELRADSKNWELKYTEMELECEKLRNEKGGRACLVQEANADLLKELERYSAQLKDTLKENVELKTLYLQACSTRDSALREMKDLQSKFQTEKDSWKKLEKDLQEKVEHSNQLSEKQTTELTNCREELDRANKRITELQKEFTDKQKEFSNKLNKYLEDEKSSMRKELEPCTQCEKQVKKIKNLEEQINKYALKLATQESNEEIIKELKSKGEYFQNYILERFQKMQEQRHVGTNTDGGIDSNNDDVTDGNKPKVNGHSEDRCSDDDEDFASKTKLMIKEKEIREQIAQKFTLEIKTVEMNCAKRLKEMENTHLNTMTKLKQLLENKAEEVETLKQFILSEREKITQILSAKENEISVLIREHNSLQDDYQHCKEKYNELKHKAEKYQEKFKLIEEKFKNDRDHSRRSLSEVEKERESLSNRLQELESEYQNLKAKYKNAKKTAYMYKDYMTKKDDHINSELNRIQSEYKEIFVKLESQLSHYVSARVKHTSSQEQRDSGSGRSRDYTEVLNRLQSDLNALAQSRYDDWRVK